MYVHMLANLSLNPGKLSMTMFQRTLRSEGTPRASLPLYRISVCRCNELENEL